MVRSDVGLRVFVWCSIYDKEICSSPLHSDLGKIGVVAW